MGAARRLRYSRRAMNPEPIPSSTSDGLKAAIRSFGQEPVNFAAAGRQVHCSHCGGLEFDSREVLMNTRGATFLNLDWLNHAAVALTCRQCSHIELFDRTPGLVG
jgi:predicted nucleic-acid-binding Zn-ribbon protein